MPGDDEADRDPDVLGQNGSGQTPADQTGRGDRVPDATEGQPARSIGPDDDLATVGAPTGLPAPNAAAAERGNESVDDPVCDLCGAPMLESHCKLICRQCGYVRDCSDP